MHRDRVSAERESTRPIIQTFPRNDIEFRDLVNRVAATSVTARELQIGLRQIHPLAVVNSSVSDNMGQPMWYVYRDGSWSKTR